MFGYMQKGEMAKKIKGLTLQFMPYHEIAKLDSVDRIKELLRIILDNKVSSDVFVTFISK